MTNPVAPPPAGGMATAQPFRLVLLIAGGIILVMLIVASVFFNKFYTGWRINQKYQETRCTIVSKQLHFFTDSEGPQSELDFQFEHRLGENTYRSSGFDGIGNSMSQEAAEATLAHYTIGESYPCWFDPKSPGHAVLAKPQYIVFLIFPLVLLLANLATIGLLWSLNRKKPHADS